MESFYERLPIADFSRLVLSANTEGLSVASLGNIGWSDLGDPRRLITTLFEAGMENPWAASQDFNRARDSWVLLDKTRSFFLLWPRGSDTDGQQQG